MTMSQAKAGEPMARIALQTPQSNPEAFAYLKAKRGDSAMFNVFRLIANVPDIMHAFIPMADVVRTGYGIDPQLRELAVIMVCQTIGSHYERDRHWNMAIGLGAPKAKLELIWDFEHRTDVFTDLEIAVLRLARDATQSPEQVESDVWQAVSDALGEQQALALLFSIAWYNMTARITGPLKLKDEPGFQRL
jgi:alkylhydroperoxidase family enzyme